MSKTTTAVGNSNRQLWMICQMESFFKMTPFKTPLGVTQGH